jgi:hypothetical protein
MHSECEVNLPYLLGRQSLKTETTAIIIKRRIVSGTNFVNVSRHLAGFALWDEPLTWELLTQSSMMTRHVTEMSGGQV